MKINRKNCNQVVNARGLNVFRKKGLCVLQFLYRWYDNMRKELIFSVSVAVSVNVAVFIDTKSVTIQINQPTRCSNFSSLLLDIYVQLNMFWA